jgi:tetratricopeptide (TPR) repeat protein
MLNTVKRAITLLLMITIFSGCAGMRAEFFRGETLYLYNRGCQHYKQGDYDAARAALEKVLSMDPHYGQAHAALGNIAIAERAPATALTHYRQAVQIDPGLEANLRPLILAATVQAVREPITKAGTDLRKVYRLVAAGKHAELEKLLTRDIPLDLLAKDTLSITPSELGELAKKMAVNAGPEKGSVRYRLFSGYLLFFAREDPVLATALIEQAVADAEIGDRKTAYMLLGQIRERLGDVNLAVDAYLLAEQSGAPPAEVAGHLSEIYGLEVESILSKAGKPQPVEALSQHLQIDLSIPLPKTSVQQMDFQSDTLKVNNGQELHEGLTISK